MKKEHVDELIRMADKFDREGKFDLAEAVDSAIAAKKAARPAVPLKNLNDDVKKNLIVFLVDAEDSVKKSNKGLNELFRRMRYFDIGDSIKDLGLDKVVKDMSKTQECLDNAKKDFYVMTFGKKPSREDLDALMKELRGDMKDKDESDMAMDFFGSEEAQAMDSESVNLEQDMGDVENLSDDDDVSDEDLAEFMDFEDEEEPGAESYSSEEIEDMSENIIMDLAQKAGIDAETLMNAFKEVGMNEPEKLFDAETLTDVIMKQRQ